MNVELYRRYLQEYVSEAIANSDGSNKGIASYLWEKKVTGFMVQHKTERERALADARKAFDEHRHWPTQIVLSQLGVETKVPGE